ncbi:alpha/beta hydrolase [Breoghania sp.]|uniref:alpha/beta fold hydrolase n=1 Tax=Breoghania sp. TaxID=2065378 RepID=UPI002AAABB1A|nr:alpha/beta hydrolase [Breoghania sp.]
MTQASASNSLASSRPYQYLPSEAANWRLVEESRVFRHQPVTATDGETIHAFTCGAQEKPTVLLINALGMSSLLMARLAKVLSCDFHVVTWETRGLPSVGPDHTLPDLSLKRHVNDALTVLSQTGSTAPFGIVAFCSGVNVALRGLMQNKLDCDRLCIVSPSIHLDCSQEETDYQRTMLPMWLDVAERGQPYASLIHRLLQSKSGDQETGLTGEVEVLDKLPFATAQSTFIYAIMQASCRDETIFANADTISIPTLVVHCDNDEIIHADTSRQLTSKLANARHLKIAHHAHYGICTSDEMHIEIMNFLC